MGSNRQWRRLQQGAAAMEWLLAAPLLLLLGLAGWQFALLEQQRLSAEFAIRQAARQAALEHGSADAINKGLAVGLRPSWRLNDQQQALLVVEEAQQMGWLRWRRLAPTNDVFADFGEPIRDERGYQRSQGLEIPNDNLRYRSTDIGAKSGLTIQQANRLQLELTIGVEMNVPLIGAFIGRLVEMFNGCQPDRDLVQGVVRFKTSPSSQRGAAPWRCAMYRAPRKDGSGSQWRLPIEVKAEAMMQSPLRALAAGGRDVGRVIIPAAPTQSWQVEPIIHSSTASAESLLDVMLGPANANDHSSGLGEAGLFGPGRIAGGGVAGDQCGPSDVM